MRFLFLLVAFFLTSLVVSSQDTIPSKANLFPDSLNKKRLAWVLASQGAIYSGAMTGLYVMYYKDYASSSFTFYNDNDSWLQMDKMGHTFASYYLSSVATYSYRFAGVEHNKSVLFGTALSFAFQLNMEILDGISSQWGFSWGDIVANSAGCLLYAGQQLGWKEQRFTVKYSFHPTEYAKYNPGILGANLAENMWEDYNGMTFWLSGNISSFLPKKSKFPKWINVAFGYSGEGLAVYNGQFPKYRQFLFSLDVDLNRIPTRSKPLKALFTVLNLIKVPFPAIEYNSLGEFRFYYLYF
jgi:uncharacterized protein YfiM (DUF2279 family)